MAHPAVASAGLPNNRHLSASPEEPGRLSEGGEEKDLTELSPLGEELKRGLQRRQGLLLSRGGGLLGVGEAVERGDGRCLGSCRTSLPGGETQPTGPVCADLSCAFPTVGGTGD